MSYMLVAAIVTLYAASAAAQIAPRYQREAMAAYRDQQFAQCAAVFERALETEPHQALTPAIGAARCHAGRGDAEKAKRHLDIALRRGYRNCKLLNEDTVFASLRTIAGWTDFAGRCRANEERFYSTINAEIFVAFLLDQADRRSQSLDTARVLERDAQRRRLVSLAIATNSLRIAEDYYHAAMIMQHGASAEDIALARRLAKRATELDPTNGNALWLYAAATDRFLQRSGRPQIYGTQLRQAGGKWTREPYDRTAVTDAERERLRVPSLAEQVRELEELNGR